MPSQKTQTIEGKAEKPLIENDKMVADFKRIRKILNLKQLDLAEILGVTQATVSRMESGKQPLSSDHKKKITQLLKTKGLKEKDLTEVFREEGGLSIQGELIEFDDEFGELDKKWNFYFATNKDFLQNSDLILVRGVSRFLKAPFLFGDMTGHGKDSAYMSFALRFGFEAMMGLLSQSVVTPELINSFLGVGMYRTKKYWKTNPSLITGIISTDKNQLEITNQGMPYPILFSKDGCKFIEKSHYPAVDIEKAVTVTASASQITLKPNESIIFYTDGLFDVIPEKEITNYIENSLAFFRGDSRAIGKNILRYITKNNRKIKDDVSFLIFSVKA